MIEPRPRVRAHDASSTAHRSLGRAGRVTVVPRGAGSHVGTRRSVAWKRSTSLVHDRRLRRGGGASVDCKRNRARGPAVQPERTPSRVVAARARGLRRGRVRPRGRTRHHEPVTAGDIVVVEVPGGSRNKYETDPKTGELFLD